MENKREETNEESKTNVEKKKLNISKIFKVIWNILSKIITILILFVSIPKYNIGDVILVKEKDIDKIKVGDDVTYKGESGSVKGLLVTHRVIDIEEVEGKKAFHTKGIANNLEDPIVYGNQINGVVQTKLYILSLICLLLNNKYVFYFCGVLPLTIYVGFRIFKGRHINE